MVGPRSCRARSHLRTAHVPALSALRASRAPRLPGLAALRVLRPSVPPRAASAMRALTWPPSRLTVGVVAGLILLAGISFGAWFWSEGQDRRATAAYVEAINRLGGNPASPPPPRRARRRPELEAVLARYPSAAMAPLGAYELGNARYSERDWGEPGCLRGPRAHGVADTQGAGARRDRLRLGGRAKSRQGCRELPGCAGRLTPGDFYYEDLLLDLARARSRRAKRTLPSRFIADTSRSFPRAHAPTRSRPSDPTGASP